MNKRMKQVQDTTQTAQDIMQSIHKIAHLKEKGLLDAFGIAISSESSERNEELTGKVYLPDRADLQSKISYH